MPLYVREYVPRLSEEDLDPSICKNKECGIYIGNAVSMSGFCQTCENQHGRKRRSSKPSQMALENKKRLLMLRGLKLRE